ncbi:MAG: preprotein translocase subunit SecG [Alphaproteobacteria bacterium]
METVLLLIHLFLAIALVIVVLLQKSEGGALGIGGGTMGGLVSARGSGNLLTKATGIIAACFIATSLILAILAGNTGSGPARSIVDKPVENTAPAKPTGPTVPLAK